MADATHDYSKTKKSYAAVGIALGVFTCVTVAIGLLPVFDFGPPGPTPSDFIIGLAVATTKASLVALIFMHLNHEKKAVYWLFASGLCMVCSLAFLTALAIFDPIHDPLFYGEETKTPPILVSPSLR